MRRRTQIFVLLSAVALVVFGYCAGVALIDAVEGYLEAASRVVMEGE